MRSFHQMVNSCRNATHLGRGTVAVLALILASCGSTPPVQEMSDARQAISVAIEAGAKEYAAADLGAAEGYLQSAEKNLADRSYTDAREDAKLAKESALAALALAEKTSPPE